jgi:diguanylate cyclase (GGDEF)-like protein
MTVSSHRFFNRRSWSWPHRLLVAAVLALLAALASQAQMFWKQDEFLYDRWIRGWRYTPDPRLLVIAIDAPSLQELGPWPWPRATHAQLLDHLAEAGTERVAMDLMLAEPDRQDAGQDAELAAAIRRNGHVVLPVVAVPTGRPGIVEELLPIPMIAANAVTLGHSAIDVDADGVTRSQFLTAGVGSPHWPSLGMALANRRGLPPGRLTQATEPASPWQWRRNHHVRVRYAGPAGTFPQVSYADVLAGRVDPLVLRGRLAMVGLTTSPASPVVTPTTDARGMSGPEYQLNVAAMLLDGKAIAQMPPLLQTLLTGLLVALCVLGLGLRRARLTALLSLPVALLLAFGLLRLGQLWFAPVAALAGIGVALVGWLAWQALRWRHLIHTDGITGLGTRRRFEQQLAQQHAAGQQPPRPLSIVLLDLDRYHSLVALHGAHAGSTALRAVAELIRAHARRPHDLTARLGTDSFALLLPDTNAEGALQLVEDLVTRVRGIHVPVQLGQTVPLTVSAGVFTGVPAATAPADMFLARAHGALMRARATGGNGYAT